MLAIFSVQIFNSPKLQLFLLKLLLLMQKKFSRHEDPPISAAAINPAHSQKENYLPHYLRQRSQEPTRINADDKSKCLLCTYALVIILPLIFCIIISVFALPYATQAINPKESLQGTNLQNCSVLLERTSLSTNKLVCYTKDKFTPGTINSLGIFVKLFSNLNQFLLFYIDLSPYANNQSSPRTNFNQTIVFTVYNAVYDQTSNSTTVVDKLHSSDIVLSSKVKYLAQKHYFLGYQSKIQAGQQYFVEVGFQNNSVITSPSMFGINVHPWLSKVETIRSNFTIYTILLRVAFFIVSLVVFVNYTMRIIKVPKKKISIQQKMVQVLAAFTLLFNDQQYFITVLWPNAVSSFLSAVFIWTFIYTLYVLWIFFLIRILQQQPDTGTVQLKRKYRIVVLSIFYLVGLTVCVGNAIIQSGDYPLVSISTVDYTWFRVYFAFLVFCFIMAIFYLFYLYAEICRKRPYRSHRHNVFMFISLFFTTAIIIMSLMGTLQVVNLSAGLIFFTFAFCNFYSYFLQYLYSPTPQQLQKFNQNSSQVGDLPELDYQEGKTVNIQLLQIQEDLGSQFQQNKAYQDSSKIQQKKKSRFEKREIRMMKEAANQKNLSNVEAGKGETHEKIVKDEVYIQQQYQQHDI